MKSASSLSFTSPRCQRLHDYWWELKYSSGQTVPRKSDFNPAAIKNILSHILIHDLSTLGKSILRLVGTGITNRLGFDPTGRDYSEFVAKDRKGDAYKELYKVASFPCGMRAILEGYYESGLVHVSESVGYPLSSDKGDYHFLVFIDDVIEKIEWHQREDKQLYYNKVRQRDYIDIGFGTPLQD
ncbi:PAS domain-containing protein [Kiloniella sp. EL199]|uniref:PAS domain-containing protein n=1 Tax=Kiloniella sp. EL199 TaxID=2107581 RepID=UPI000EA04448|nr:PAS domain-containing protein [Kiloniella sp. EL199]